MSNRLSRLIKILTLKCDEASLLMSDSFDRPLHFDERWALRGHLLVCSVCPKLHAQMRFVVQAGRRRGKGNAAQQVTDEVMQTTDQTNDARLSDEAKQRIRTRLRDAESQ